MQLQKSLPLSCLKKFVSLSSSLVDRRRSSLLYKERWVGGLEDCDHRPYLSDHHCRRGRGAPHLPQERQR